MDIIRTEIFNLAYRFVTETNRNIFLTGKAGTGKTTFLKYLRENSVKRIVVAAPTGVAAINAHGVTLHSLFQLPLGVIPPAPFEEQNKLHPFLSKIHYHREKLNLLRNMELLVIDEASMLPCYLVDAVDSILRYIRKRPNDPFGGVQVLFIGDLYQLPPVVKSEDQEILESFYKSPFFFDSLILRDNIPVIIELNKIFRQKDDKFIEILNGIRNNDITEESFMLLNSRINRNFLLQNSEGYIILTTHNYQSDEINKRKMDALSSREYIFHSEVVGEFPEHLYPVESELKLKRGAQVMFLKNDNEGKQYFNGKIGVITNIGSNEIKVKCKDCQYEIEVKKSEWQNIRYIIDHETREIKEEVIGTFTHYPLRLAWAITIHKSQGLTFDKVIINAERAFAAGQVYVALSRCTTLEGLVLISPVNINILGAHECLKEWEDRNHNTNLQHAFIESRDKFIIQELQNIFTWANWRYGLKELKEVILENQSKISGDAISWITESMDKQNELYETAERFKEEIIRLSFDSQQYGKLIEENELLQKRIQLGANYFFDEVSKWGEQFAGFAFSVETKKLTKTINSLLEDISSTQQEMLRKFNYCKNGFLLNNYLIEAKNNFGKTQHTVKLLSQIKNRYVRNKVTAERRNTEKSDTVEVTLKLFRRGKSIEQISAERNLAVSTIEGHLAKAIGQKLIGIEEVIPIEEAQKIAGYFPEDLIGVRLAEIREKTPDEITYGKLKMVLAWLRIK